MIERHGMTPALPPLPSQVATKPVERKRCSSCWRVWLPDHFGRDKRASDGLRSQCQHCERADQRAKWARRNCEARVG